MTCCRCADADDRGVHPLLLLLLPTTDHLAYTVLSKATLYVLFPFQNVHAPDSIQLCWLFERRIRLLHFLDSSTSNHYRPLCTINGQKVQQIRKHIRQPTQVNDQDRGRQSEQYPFDARSLPAIHQSVSVDRRHTNMRCPL
jgi:hypothetical protein